MSESLLTILFTGLFTSLTTIFLFGFKENWDERKFYRKNYFEKRIKIYEVINEALMRNYEHCCLLVSVLSDPKTLKEINVFSIESLKSLADILDDAVTCKNFYLSKDILIKSTRMIDVMNECLYPFRNGDGFIEMHDSGFAEIDNNIREYFKKNLTNNDKIIFKKFGNEIRQKMRKEIGAEKFSDELEKLLSERTRKKIQEENKGK